MTESLPLWLCLYCVQEEAQQQQSAIEAMGAQIRQLSEGSGGPSFNDQFAALHKKLGKLHRHVS